jgi:hypothetical protein
MKTTKLIRTAAKNNNLFFGEVEKTDSLKVKGGFKYSTEKISGIFVKTDNGDLYQLFAPCSEQLDAELVYTSKKRLCNENLFPCTISKMKNYFSKKIYLEKARMLKAIEQKTAIEVIQSFLKDDCQKQIKHLIMWTYGGEYNLIFRKIK